MEEGAVTWASPAAALGVQQQRIGVRNWSLGLNQSIPLWDMGVLMAKLISYSHKHVSRAFYTSDFYGITEYDIQGV